MLYLTLSELDNIAFEVVLLFSLHCVHACYHLTTHTRETHSLIPIHIRKSDQRVWIFLGNTLGCKWQRKLVAWNHDLRTDSACIVCSISILKCPIPIKWKRVISNVFVYISYFQQSKWIHRKYSLLPIAPINIDAERQSNKKITQLYTQLQHFNHFLVTLKQFLWTDSHKSNSSIDFYLDPVVIMGIFDDVNDNLSLW